MVGLWYPQWLMANKNSSRLSGGMLYCTVQIHLGFYNMFPLESPMAWLSATHAPDMSRWVYCGLKRLE